MTTADVRQWVDEMVSLEAADLPHKPEGAIHIIVYDKTNVPPPGAKTVGDRVRLIGDPSSSLTFWWKTGSFLDQIRFFADYTVAAADWPEAFAGIMEALTEESQKLGRQATIASLQFWGHGAPGISYMGNDTLSEGAVKAGGEHATAVAQVAAAMHSTEGSVWFRQCNCFMGEKGHAFARATASAFGATTVGHTFIIHAWQSGTRFLRPGQQPKWDVHEGTKRRGRNKGDFQVSAPIRRRTVNMFRLYPPLDEGEWVIPNGILAPMRRGVTKLADD